MNSFRRSNNTSTINNQPDSPTVTAVVQITLLTFLTEQSYLLAPKKRFRITPATKSRGYNNTAIEHDHILANLDFENSA
jgi:hypothetical protein